jgi:putative CocE/NonD family hydrolase
MNESTVHIQWGVKIPLRDQVRLNATLYLPERQPTPAPALITLTPYVGQTYHHVALYFAARGYPFLTVDVRGRGNSEGEFQPLIQEANDGYDLVEWLARQPYCNGQVSMWGGSYGGFDQWATAAQRPPHLATIVPVAPPYVGVDFPMRNNIFYPYLLQWLTLVAGHASQDRMFWNQERFWGARFAAFFESGAAFESLDEALGMPSPIFQGWIANPQQGPHWDRYNPTPEQYSKLSLPILTITGHYDGDQPGSLMHYREHLKHAGKSARHYLVIGPWDHAGTRAPQLKFAGVEVGPASLVDLGQLHQQWYAWTMQGGSRPEFLKNNVAYYVMGAEKWRYADTLEGVTARSETLFLQSKVNPTDVFKSGALTAEQPSRSGPDHYVYDPRDVSHAAIERNVDPEDRSDQRMAHLHVGKQLVYHSEPFAADTEVSGFFRLSAWLAIDQPDTDFYASVYEIDLHGRGLLLTNDFIRARYRESLREERLIDTPEPLRYDFERFMFVSRLIRTGHRLRLIIGPGNSIYRQKNYNTGGVIVKESMKDARVVNVKLFHDEAHPSALYVPIGKPE